MAGVKGRSGNKNAASVGIETRFKPGLSGNPAGSSRKERLTALLRTKLEEAVNPGTTASVKQAEAVISALLSKATTGDIRAIEVVLERSDGKVTDKLDLNANVNVASLDLGALSPKELLALDEILSRASADDAASNS